MNRRIPVFATLVVLAAVATMIALGFWQLGRLREKEALLERYRTADTLDTTVAWPITPEAAELGLYRRSQVACARVERMEARAGTSSNGQSGWALVAHCRLPDGAAAEVALGWSARPDAPSWAGGAVSGTIAKAGKGVRLVASPAVAGLAELARPDPASVPNNHLSYAVQWFAFAATALIIYALALRKRWRASAA